MAAIRQSLLFKLSGSILRDSLSGALCIDRAIPIIQQIKELNATHQCAIVIGGGNIIRGTKDASIMHIAQHTGHQIGILATHINALLLSDIAQQQGLEAVLICAADTDIHERIAHAHEHHKLIIFSGGLGIPYFSTDTAAVLRAIQIHAPVVYKATNIDGVYTADPRTNKEARKLTQISLTDALQQQLGILDLTAYALALQYKLAIRIFDVSMPHACIEAVRNTSFGSTITP